MVVPEYGGAAMLVLSRKKQQSVMVGGCNGFERMLKVTVIEIRGSTVRLGFDASAELPVHRTEVWERISAQSRRPPLSRDREWPSELPLESD
jgi:carbon storage regulator